MDKRKIILLIYLLCLLSFPALPYTSNAEVPKAKAVDSSSLQKEALLCQQIQDKIKNKQEIFNVIKTSIQMGDDACGVIKCAIKGGEDLKQIIEGAAETGITIDVVARCSLNACAEAKDVEACAKDVAVILNNMTEPGLGYSLPEDPAVVVTPLTGVNKGGAFLSPSGF